MKQNRRSSKFVTFEQLKELFHTKPRSEEIFFAPQAKDKLVTWLNGWHAQFYLGCKLDRFLFELSQV